MEHEKTQDKNAGAACDLEEGKCKPCIVSKLMVVFLIGYALFQFFGK